MFTIAQITAIVGLLVSFGVPNATVESVQEILNNPQKIEVEAPVSNDIETPARTSIMPPAYIPMVVGTSTEGYEVYRSSGGLYYVVDPGTGCKKAMDPKPFQNGTYHYPVGGTRTYCSSNQ